MKLRFAHLLLLASFAACKTKSPVQNDAAPKAAALQEKPPKNFEPPTSFERDSRKSEQSATEITDSVFKPLCENITNSKSLDSFLTKDFQGYWISESLQTTKAFRVHEKILKSNVDSLDNLKFASSLTRFSSLFADVQRCSSGVSKFYKQSDNDAWATLNFQVAGFYSNGERVSLSGYPKILLKKEGGAWKIDGWSKAEYIFQYSRVPLFVEVSRWVGADFRRSFEFHKIIQRQMNTRKIETIGGLAVVDWNNDSRHDFIAWNRRRTMQIFINDGTAGFDKIVNPLPSNHVGLHHVYFDIDGDGSEELISSEVVDCKKGVAEFPVYSKKKTRLKRRRGLLKFKRDCNGVDQIKFQHIAVADINDDGKLDLFFAGFSNQFSKSFGHNRFRSKKGEPNRLFLSNSRGKYTEVAAERGVAGNSFSYASLFTDYNKDGHQDIYVVNDYGRNVIYENNGQGFFNPSRSALAENGQSMGVSEVDINEDGELDYYVSNMYSKAGNRIVPLAKDKLKNETYDELLAVAKGNSALIRNPSQTDKFSEEAQELGIAKAGWAWGHTFFDYDQDGRTELLVLNGNVTHSDAKAPDY
ncbi:MAG: VCBS repeat-containing protein [Myxococcota bacterium]|nr:VCBS repeat-containing protein [Myxococcota bacterium]